MDSPQSVVSPFKSSLVTERESQKSDFFSSTTNLSKGIDEDFIGVLDVYVHQARDIHNICIYHKQDVYAKLCLTSDPENAVSTKTINGGGRNPVFNDNVRLNVKTVESSLKCEIYMMSRVRNYLEDQLLGFALVPLSDVVIKDGKLEEEFSLSSTDLFHSPAGFVQLSLAYNGASPEVMAIPAIPRAVGNNETMQDSKMPKSIPSEFENIEFPDPKVVNENQMMVSEYYGLTCAGVDSDRASLESESSKSLVNSDAENRHSSEAGDRVLESFSAAVITDSKPAPKLNSPPSSVSTNGVSSLAAAAAAASSESSDTHAASKSRGEDHVSGPKEKTADAGYAESNSSNGVPKEEIPKPVITVNMEPEQNVVQQDIVDMYMKSMQQFTESLAKMKLPLDIDSGPASLGDSSSDEKSQGSKTPGSRVFYGSRAFF